MGGMTSYYIGRIGDWKKIEKYFKIKKEKVLAFKLRIDKWGSVLAFFTWFPLGGDILALSLGFFKVDAYKVSIWMLIGKFFRFVVSAIIIFSLASFLLLKTPDETKYSEFPAGLNVFSG